MDMGPRPSAKHTVERIDVDGDYTPENCRWATMKEQSYTSRRAVLIEHSGVTATQSDWARAAGITQSNLGRRIRDGWQFVDAITRPTRLTAKGGLSEDEVVRRAKEIVEINKEGEN